MQLEPQILLAAGGQLLDPAELAVVTHPCNNIGLSLL
jgi:hypothetical protein